MVVTRTERLAAVEEIVRTRVPEAIVVGGGDTRTASSWAALDAARCDTLLAHELAHYARGDHWVRWLELIVAVLFWWHPAAWVARVKLREAE